MKKIVLLVAVSAVLVASSLAGTTSCAGRRSQASDTLRVNTSELCKDIIGFDGPTPVEITVVKGVITEVKALPNTESPRYLQHVLESGLLSKLVGKTVEEAKDTPLDAVSGATYTSEALIQNVRKGLEEVPVQ